MGKPAPTKTSALYVQKERWCLPGVDVSVVYMGVLIIHVNI